MDELEAVKREFSVQSQERLEMKELAVSAIFVVMMLPHLPSLQQLFDCPHSPYSVQGMSAPQSVLSLKFSTPFSLRVFPYLSFSLFSFVCVSVSSSSRLRFCLPAPTLTSCRISVLSASVECSVLSISLSCSLSGLLTSNTHIPKVPKGHPPPLSVPSQSRSRGGAAITRQAQLVHITITLQDSQLNLTDIQVQLLHLLDNLTPR